MFSTIFHYGYEVYSGIILLIYLFFEVLYNLIFYLSAHWMVTLGTIISLVSVIKTLQYLGYGGMNLSMRLRSPYAKSLSLVSPPTHAQPHRFFQQRVGLFNRPVFCNVCSCVMIEKALCCGVCGYSSHKSCLPRADNNCKYVFFDQISASNQLNAITQTPQTSSSSSSSSKLSQVVSSQEYTTPTDATVAFRHQWVQGNHSTVKDVCVVCGVTCGSLFGLSGMSY